MRKILRRLTFVAMVLGLGLGHIVPTMAYSQQEISSSMPVSGALAATSDDINAQGACVAVDTSDPNWNYIHNCNPHRLYIRIYCSGCNPWGSICVWFETDEVRRYDKSYTSAEPCDSDWLSEQTSQGGTS